MISKILFSSKICNLNLLQKLNKRFCNTSQNISDFKLIFDTDNKAIVFLHQNGIRELKWIVRGIALFTILNTFLMVSEYINPIFGGWNLLSFTGSTIIGFGALYLLHVYSKRTIREIKIFRAGDFVELKFFNALWIPESKVFSITEFANLQKTYFNFTRTEITSYGKIWINTEKNIYAGIEENEEILNEILSGKFVKFNQYDKTMKKYKKYKN